MAFTELIAATTAYDTETLSIGIDTTITADELSGGEKVIVQVKKVDGTYKDLWVEGKQVILTSSNNTIVISGIADYQFIKNITANSVAVGYQ